MNGSLYRTEESIRLDKMIKAFEIKVDMFSVDKTLKVQLDTSTLIDIIGGIALEMADIEHVELHFDGHIVSASLQTTTKTIVVKEGFKMVKEKYNDLCRATRKSISY